MRRDFTDAGLQKLKGYVDSATSHTTLERIADVFGDLGTRIAGFFGFFNIGKYANDMDTYHQKVIDAQNSTKAQLQEIFDNVRAIDETYGASCKDQASVVRTLTTLIDDLAATVDPNGGNLDMAQRKQILDASVNALAHAKTTKDDNIAKNSIGTDPDSACKSVDPVNLSSGNFIYDRSDLWIDTDLGPEFHRYYNSLSHKAGALGFGFSHSYELTVVKHKSRYNITMPDGMHIRFEESEGIFEAVDDLVWRMERVDDTIHLCSADGITNILDSDLRLIRRENRAGFGVQLRYTEDGKLQQVRNDYGDFLQFTYNENGLISEVADSTGRKVSYAYRQGRLTKAVLPDGLCLEYSYDNADGITELKSNERTLIQNEYDNRYRVTRQRFADGSSMSFLYDDAERTVTQIERNGVRTVYVHDEEYRNTETRYEDGTTEKFVYNDKSQCIKYTDRLGHVMRMSYDNRGNLVQRIDASRRRMNFTYNADGQLFSFAVNGKIIRKNHYDAKGNLLYTEGNLSKSPMREYDAEGHVTRMQNEDGSIETYAYDEKGNLIEITKPSGAVYRFVYNEQRQITKVVDPNGNISEFDYNEAGQLIREKNALGDCREYRYRKDGLLQADIDFDGVRRERSYTAVNLLSEYQLTPESRVHFSYDSMWNLTRETLAGGASIQYAYDRENRLVKETGADGVVTEYEYDLNGALTAVIEGGSRTEYQYDAAGRVVCEINPEGGETRYTYDAFDQVIHIEDSIGNKADLLYDADQRLIAEEDNFGEKRYYEYDAAGRIAKITNEFGTGVSYSYVPGGDNYRTITYADGTSETFDYDGNGNRIAYRDRLGNETTFVYDAIDRLISYATNGVLQKSYVYDRRNNVIETTDGTGRCFRYRYNLLDQLTEVINPDETRAVYTYDANGRMQKNEIFAADGTLIGSNTYDLDANGQVVKVTDIDGSEECFAYEADGVMAEHRDRDGYLTRYSHNKLGQIDRIAYADGRTAVLKHNAFGHLERVEDWLGVTEIQNDGLGRALAVNYPDGRSVAYRYNSYGKRTQIRYSDGKEVSYHYDPLQRLTEIDAAGEKYTYVYGERGELQKRMQPGGIETEYAYDPLGYVSQIISRKKDTVLDRIGICHDAFGRKQSMLREISGCEEENGLFEYRYDAVGRLTDVLHDGDPYHSYDFDAFGNIIADRDAKDTTYFTYNRLNQLIHRKNATEENDYQYDRRGNLIRSYRNGQLQQEFSYGALNRMEKAVNANGRSAVYRFNGLGHRVGEDRILPGESAQSLAYVVDMTQVYDNLLETHAEGENRSFFWDPYQLIGMERNGSRSSFAQDEMGSVIRRFRADGSVAETTLFDMYGRTGWQSGADGANPFGYLNYYRDEFADSYFVQARNYQPDLLRFTACDYYRGMEDHVLSQNRYLLCWDDPVNYEDRDGRFGILAIAAAGAAIGAAAGGLVSIATQAIEVKQGKKDKIDWGKVAGSAVEGAVVGGVGALLPVSGPVAFLGTVAAGGAGAAAGNFTEQAINKGIKNVDGREVAENAVVGAVVSGVFYGLGKGVDKLLGKESKQATKEAYREKTSELKEYGRKIAAKQTSGDRRGINKMFEKQSRLLGEQAGLLGKYAKEQIKKSIVSKRGIVSGVLQGDGAVGKVLYSVLGLKAGKTLVKDFMKNVIPLHDNGKDAGDELGKYFRTQGGKITGECPIYAAA